MSTLTRYSEASYRAAVEGGIEVGRENAELRAKLAEQAATIKSIRRFLLDAGEPIPPLPNIISLLQLRTREPWFETLKLTARMEAELAAVREKIAKVPHLVQGVEVPFVVPDHQGNGWEEQCARLGGACLFGETSHSQNGRS